MIPVTDRLWTAIDNPGGMAPERLRRMAMAQQQAYPARFLQLHEGPPLETSSRYLATGPGLVPPGSVRTGIGIGIGVGLGLAIIGAAVFAMTEVGKRVQGSRG